jgi:hypothetical protein
MVKARDPYHEALTALTAFAGANRFGWGEPLVATSLAVELGLSPTPVREALARLSGEGLIEHRPGRGYYAPSPSPEDIIDLYEMHCRLVHWALDLLAADAANRPFDPIDGSSAERLFTGVARAPGRAFLARAHWRATLQLRPVRAIGARLSPEDPGWTTRVLPLFATGAIDAFRGEIDAYHHDLRAGAAGIVAVMRQSVQSIEQI